MIFVIVVFGGMGLMVGVVIVVFVFIVVLELLCSFVDICVLLFGIFMVVMMIWWLCGLICISWVGFVLCKGVVL